MRVLHVISGIDVPTGGPGTALVGLGSAQAQVGLDVTVLTAFAQGADLAPAEQLKRDGVNVQLIGPVRTPLGLHSGIPAKINELLDQADIVHIHGLWEEIQHRAARLACARGIPYLITPHGMLDPWSLSQRALKKRLYMAWRLRTNLNRAAAIHYTAETERELAEPLGLRPPALIELNGVDLREFEKLPEKGSFRKLFPQIGQRPLILFLSRIHLKKGLDMLIPAMAKVKTPDAILVIIGPDPWGYGQTIKDLIQQHGIGDRTIFVGQVPADVRIAAFTDADIFVLPSYQENFGIAVAEALAAGTPVVISDQVNIHREISAAGVGGVVRRDVDLVAAEMDRWLQDAELRRAAAEKARPFVWDRWGWTQIARRWIGHYDRIVAEHRAAKSGHAGASAG
ncbi:MAG TPA: glycosyltransferase [Tepidisphaeraceae bacterium]|nr:glycosyltransferase [Tepidisphaeraceae bacterium]